MGVTTAGRLGLLRRFAASGILDRNVVSVSHAVSIWLSSDDFIETGTTKWLADAVASEMFGRILSIRRSLHASSYEASERFSVWIVLVDDSWEISTAFEPRCRLNAMPASKLWIIRSNFDSLFSADSRELVIIGEF